MVGPSPVCPGLPGPRVWNYLGVSHDPTRRFAQTGTRAQKSFEDVARAGATVLRVERRENIAPQ